MVDDVSALLGYDVAARPREILLTVLGAHVLPAPDLRVSMSAFVELLAELSVGRHAARATVQRAVANELLDREQCGRQAYFSLTHRARRLLVDGTQRILSTPPYRHDWDGTWTLLSFSLPESRREVRHRLRVRLSWSGFGPLRDGLWVAPGPADLDGLLDDLAVHGEVEVFVGAVHRTPESSAFPDRAWDLAALGRRYEAFARRWSGTAPDRMSTDLAREVSLLTDWRLLIRDDPRLPEECLPRGWPAGSAHARFLRRYEQWQPAAHERFRQTIASV